MSFGEVDQTLGGMLKKSLRRECQRRESTDGGDFPRVSPAITERV